MLKSEVKFYQNLIQHDFWPYWTKFIDVEHGGVFTCISNDGKTLLSKDKYTWSQGRFLWLCASLYECVSQSQLELDAEMLKTVANQTAKFLIKHAVMEGNRIAFLLKNDGVIDEETKDDSIFADCFFILGLSKYAKVFKDNLAYEVAEKVYKSVRQRIEQNDFNTAPYPTPVGYESQSIEMILLNVSQELAEAEKEIENTMHYTEYAFEHSAKLFKKFYHQDGRIIEFLSAEPEQQHSILSAHINPGHTIEAIWFHIHLYEMNQIIPKEILEQCSKLFNFNFSIAWDSEYGGLRRFIVDDKKIAKYPMEKLILETSNLKLWWPHSETLYTSLLLFDLTQDKQFLDAYQQTKQYVFNHFPNHEVGEWYQILDRIGQPVNKVVALPVKDPFHILRNFILIVRRWSA